MIRFLAIIAFFLIIPFKSASAILTDSSILRPPTATTSPSLNTTYTLNSGTFSSGTSSPTLLAFQDNSANARPALTSGGYYLVTVMLSISNASSTSSLIYVVDDWVVTKNSSGTEYNVRLFYTGDAGATISPSATASVYYYGESYLSIGAVIYAPRIWALSGSGAVNSGTYTITLLNS